MGLFGSLSEGAFFQKAFDIGCGCEEISEHIGNKPNIKADKGLRVILSDYRPGSREQHTITAVTSKSYHFTKMSREEFDCTGISGELCPGGIYKLICVIDGELRRDIGGEKHVFPAGHCVLMNCGVRHTGDFSAPFTVSAVPLPEDMFLRLSRLDRGRDSAGAYDSEGEALSGFFSLKEPPCPGRRLGCIDFVPRKQTGTLNVRVKHIYENLIRILLFPEPGDEYLFYGYVYKLLFLLRDSGLFDAVSYTYTSSPENALFSQIERFVEESDRLVTRETLVNKFHYSGGYLNSVVRNAAGMSIGQYARRSALRRASKMLSGTDRPIADIISELGFSNRSFFYSEFKKSYGYTPKQYRASRRRKGMA